MAIFIRKSGAWIEMRRPSVRHSGSWRGLRFINVWDELSKVWREVWRVEDPGIIDPPEEGDFITGDELAEAIGLTDGISQNSDSPWLGFSFNGEYVYVPQKTFRQDITWQSIYQAGAVYGTDDYGRHPVGGNRIQDARVTIKGKEYRVTLLKGANAEDLHVPLDPEQRYDVYMSTMFSEWNQLMYRVAATGIPDPASQPYGVWHQYSAEELFMNYPDNSGTSSWCQERCFVNNQPRRVIRGTVGVTYFDGDHPQFYHYSMGWRPALRTPM